MMKWVGLVLLAVCFSVTSTFGVEKIVIGTDFENGGLYVPFQVEEGPDGNIYVFDAKDKAIKVYSPQGKYLLRMGGAGEGPGEFKRLGQFAFYDQDTILITEAMGGHRWITYLDLKGKLKKILKVDLRQDEGIDLVKKISGNRLIAEIGAYEIPRKMGSYWGIDFTSSLATIDEEGKIKKILSQSYLFSIASVPDGAYKRVPFSPDDLWDITGDETIIFSDGCSNVFKCYDLNGKPVGDIKTGLPDAVKVTQKDFDKWKEDFKKKFIQKEADWDDLMAIKNYHKSVYKVIPVFVDISITPSGNIWVWGDKEKDDTVRKYWLLNQKGKLLAKVELSATQVRFSKNFIFLIAEETEGDVVYCFKRKGPEEKDIMIIAREQQEK